jgi:hypothetical protein
MAICRGDEAEAAGSCAAVDVDAVFSRAAGESVTVSSVLLAGPAPGGAEEGAVGVRSIPATRRFGETNIETAPVFANYR